MVHLEIVVTFLVAGFAGVFIGLFILDLLATRRERKEKQQTRIDLLWEGIDDLKARVEALEQ